jgi:hypothetical protein
MTYTYRRPDGTTFEYTQSMNDEPLKYCPYSGKPVERVITGGIGTTIPGHMQASGSKRLLNPNDFPTTMKDYRKKVFRDEQ